MYTAGSLQPPAPPPLVAARKRPRSQCALLALASLVEQEVLLARFVEQSVCSQANTDTQPRSILIPSPVAIRIDQIPKNKARQSHAIGCLQ